MGKKNKEVRLEFTCPQCGGHQLCEILEVHEKYEIGRIVKCSDESLNFQLGKNLGEAGDDHADHAWYECGQCGHAMEVMSDLKPCCKPQKARTKADARPEPAPFTIVDDIRVMNDNLAMSGAYILWLDIPLVQRILALRAVAHQHGLSEVCEFNRSVSWYGTDTDTLREELKSGADLSEREGLRVCCEELSVSDGYFAFKAIGKHCDTPIETDAIYFNQIDFGRILKHFNLELPALPEKEAPDGQEAKEGD